MPKLLEYSPYKLAYRSIIMGLAEKGKRPADGRDPQAGTGDETFSMDQFVQLAQFLLRQESIDTARDMSIATMMFSCCGSSDDVLLLHLADLIAPRLIKSIGKSCLLVCNAKITLHMALGCNGIWPRSIGCFPVNLPRLACIGFSCLLC